MPASKALPPRSRIPMPTAVAIQWVEATTPKVPSITGRVVKGLGLMLPAIGSCARFLETPPNHSLEAGPTRFDDRRFCRSVRLRARELHHLGPLFGFFGNVLSKLGSRAGDESGAHAVETLLHSGIGEDRVDGRVEL